MCGRVIMSTTKTSNRLESPLAQISKATTAEISTTDQRPKNVSTSNRPPTEASSAPSSKKSTAELPTTSSATSKRSTSKMSTGSMLAGSFSHSERRKKVSRLESLEAAAPPSYADDESRKRAYDSAIQTEIEFLEFAESLNLPADNFLPSPIDEETPSSILREMKSNKNESEKENTSPMKSESQMRVTSQHDSTPTRTKRSSRSPSFSGNNRQKVGLDHLENLVRLMEELSSLREQNLSLKRKVHDMETEKTREIQIHESVVLQNDVSMSSIGSVHGIQNSPEAAVKTLNKIALNQRETETEISLQKPKKISDISSPPAARSRNGKTLTRSSRLEEEDFVTNEMAINQTPDPGMGVSKPRVGAWNKVKDVFKTSSPGPVRSSSMQNQAIKEVTLNYEKTKSLENFSAYLAAVESTSSASDDDQEFTNFNLYNINYDLAFDLSSVQRSSSFSQVSELQPSFSSNLTLPRRHSMISIDVGDDDARSRQPIQEQIL